MNLDNLTSLDRVNGEGKEGLSLILALSCWCGMTWCSAFIGPPKSLNSSRRINLVARTLISFMSRAGFLHRLSVNGPGRRVVTMW